MKKTIKKAFSIVLIGTVLLPILSGCGTVGESDVSESVAIEADQIAQATNSLLRSHSDTKGKQETVYVIADAEGNPNETIVSEWLKNPDGADTLEDVSYLTRIVNIKGEETYTEGAGGHIRWAANGSDIYYQGATDKELPVTTSISYKMNGKTVSAKDLAGTSGHLVITFDYTNHTAEKREVNGKTVTLYQPFLVISGLMLDEETASNITVSKGKVFSTGDRSIAVGLAAPGLKESLGLDAMKNRDGKPVNIDLPDSVVIEADVQDFELLTTITIISNDALQELDLDDVKTIDELKDAMDELTDASARLVEGTGDLYDGVERLSDGTTELTDGIGQLDEGAGNLKTGANALSDGASQLSGGADTLSRGANTLADSVGQVSDGASALNNGMGSVKTGVGSLTSGLTQLQTSVTALPDGVDALYQGTALVKNSLKNDEGQSIYAGLQSIEAGAGAVSAGLAGEDGSILTAANGIASGAEQLAEGADNLSAAAESLRVTLGDIIAKVENLPPAVVSLIGADTVNYYLEQARTAYSVLGQMKGGADSISAGLNGDGASIKNAAAGIVSGAQQLDEGAIQIQNGVHSLETGVDTIVSEENLGAILAGLAGLSENADALVGGIDQLTAGATLLSQGVGQTADGASRLANGATALTGGTSQVASGASALASGAAQLGDGADQLASGAGELADGTARLRDGGTELADGVEQLLGGAKELMNGMAEFDEKGIRELAKLVEEDAQELIDRLKAVKELGKEYTSFAGADSDMPGTVQFIIRTEAIEK